MPSVEQEPAGSSQPFAQVLTCHAGYSGLLSDNHKWHILRCYDVLMMSVEVAAWPSSCHCQQDSA
ncbi:hypothetical protein GUJ93_ZPchr0006g42554 [Zizania palustris]|uniref:Uncharacterized protein n=1 Tax=Zizania palustris TaxID=103762 RepID=A0A8J5SX96_ZIZPA|nr:hypothetical protein GUJ93_ZPchr0006g42554 [Zizania palustris]